MKNEKFSMRDIKNKFRGRETERLNARENRYFKRRVKILWETQNIRGLDASSQVALEFINCANFYIA